MSKFHFPELKNHNWEFSYIGGIPRVQLNNAKDIQALEHLDHKLWAALSCPVNGLELDAETLKKMDIDGDEFIRIPDVLYSVYWTLNRIKNPQDLTQNNDFLPLSAINEATSEGKNLLESAQQVLKNLGKFDAQRICKSDTFDITKIFANTRFNGDGVITEASADTPELKSLIHMMLQFSSTPDKNGQLGIDTNITEAFFQACTDYLSWQNSKKSPFGDTTAEAYTSYLAVQLKIEDYFLRCQLSEFDTEANAHLQVSIEQYKQLSVKNIAESAEDISLLPLAVAKQHKKLPLKNELNPVWIDKIQDFNKKTIQEIFPNIEELSLEHWNIIKGKFLEYETWLSAKKGTEVEFLSVEIITKIVQDNPKLQILDLIAKDKEFEDESKAVDELDTLVRFYCDLPILLRNFVNFNDFYDPKVPAIFQSGKLYIDERCCDLSVEVHDMSRQDLMASSGNVCLLYCECYSKNKDKKITIVSALTDGSLDNITIGRNGVYVDYSGEDWSATVVKIIEQPISIKEAFWSPYKKVAKFISDQIEKFASSKSKEMELAATANVEKTTVKVETGIKESMEKKDNKPVENKNSAVPATPVTPFDLSKYVGIFAAISLALGALGSILMNFLTSFFALKWWQMPIALSGLILTISLPAMFLAFLKIRRRNFAPVLDANGWAINSSIKINILFGRSLTHIARLPFNARINFNDPFKKRSAIALPLLFVVCVVLAFFIFFAVKNGWFPKLNFLKPN